MSQALARTARLAKVNGARLTVIDVVPPPPGDLHGLLGDRPVADLQAAALRERQEQLRSMALSIERQLDNVVVEVLVGIPFVEAIRAVLRNGYDLVVKLAERQHGAGGPLFGSTDKHLLRKCPCPVWIARAPGPRRYGRLLAAVDPDPEDSERQELNRFILDLTLSLAVTEHSDVHIVHAWRVYRESTLRGPLIRMPAEQVDSLVRATRRVHREWLEALLGPYELDRLNVRIHLLKGDPRDVIPAVARQKQIDLIVMGTVARTGISGLLIGNTAESVLSQVDCSVLTVKPPGFVSPIALEPRR